MVGSMAARLVTMNRDTPVLPPPDMRQWVPENHLAHVVLDAVDARDLGAARANHRGSGSSQYPPALMLGLFKRWNWRHDRGDAS